MLACLFFVFSFSLGIFPCSTLGFGNLLDSLWSHLTGKRFKSQKIRIDKIFDWVLEIFEPKFCQNLTKLNPVKFNQVKSVKSLPGEITI